MPQPTPAAGLAPRSPERGAPSAPREEIPLRRAWLEAWKDPDVLAAAAQSKFEVSAQGHEAVEAGVQTILGLPDSQVPRIKEIFALN